MTEGEKMVWAAVYSQRSIEGMDFNRAVIRAWAAVDAIRGSLDFTGLGVSESRQLEIEAMLREMLE